MEDVVKYVKPFNNPVYINRNLYPGEKDFGVSMDKIKESIVLM